jgi:hypothetical protein
MRLAYSEAATSARGRLRAAWQAACGAIGAVLGLVPHLLHHVSLFAGTVLVAGAVGNVIFAVLGVAASVPVLLRLRRRFGTWRAPAVALGIFAAMFSLSAFVMGPAISGEARTAPEPVPAVDHEGHHAP